MKQILQGGRNNSAQKHQGQYNSILTGDIEHVFTDLRVKQH